MTAAIEDGTSLSAGCPAAAVRSRCGLTATGVLASIILAALTLPGVARADPCEGRLPSRSGQAFDGTVRYVGDGDSLCVGSSSDPATWIEVRLADFDAPELHSPTGRTDRDRLVRIVQGRRVECVAVRGRNGRVIVYDRVIARCRLNGRGVGELLRAAGAREGGN